MSSLNQYLPYPPQPQRIQANIPPPSTTLARLCNEKHPLPLSLFKTASHSVHRRVPSRTRARPGQDKRLSRPGRARVSKNNILKNHKERMS